MLQIHPRMLLPVLGATLLAATEARGADLISFEPDASGYLPDGTLATDNLRINTQFRPSHGVSFGADSNGDLQIDPGSYAILERGGSLGSTDRGSWGFVSTDANGQYDSAASGFENQLGNWFMKTNQGGDTLLISYDNPVAAASGELWDIDGRTNGNYEQWAVTAYSANGRELGRIESPAGLHNRHEGSLDSRPWVWSFDLGYNASIATISMQNIGTTNGPVGFNNFAASSPNANADVGSSVGSPEASFSLIACSFLALSLVGRKRQP